MKVMLVIDSPSITEDFSECLSENGCDLIRYKQIIKAMDNIEEISPHAVIISAEDFPRHWKTFVQFLRSQDKFEKIPVVLIAGKSFSQDEGDKALWLGINAILVEGLKNDNDRQLLLTSLNIKEMKQPSSFEILDRIKNDEEINIISQTKQKKMGLLKLAVKMQSPHLDSSGAVEFSFINPITLDKVEGSVLDADNGLILFKPNDFSFVSNIQKGQKISFCTLKTKTSTLKFSTELLEIHQNNTITLKSEKDI